MTINQLQDAVIEEFSDIDDWMDKYQMLIDLGNELDTLDEQYKNNQNLIDGCQSRVWIQCDYKDGKLYFTADSDALIVKGIIRSSAGIRRPRFSMQNFTLSTASDSKTICLPPAATDCWP